MYAIIKTFFNSQGRFCFEVLDRTFVTMEAAQKVIDELSGGLTKSSLHYRSVCIGSGGLVKAINFARIQGPTKGQLISGLRTGQKIQDKHHKADYGKMFHKYICATKKLKLAPLLYYAYLSGYSLEGEFVVFPAMFKTHSLLLEHTKERFSVFHDPAVAEFLCTSTNINSVLPLSGVGNYSFCSYKVGFLQDSKGRNTPFSELFRSIMPEPIDELLVRLYFSNLNLPRERYRRKQYIKYFSFLRDNV